MKNVTSIKIFKPATEIFEAFVDPDKIGNFWFSSSSERWAAGKTITLRYEEYGAEGGIQVLEVDPGKKIVFNWGNTVTISFKEELEDSATVVEIVEEGFDESNEQFLHIILDNKEGWVYTLSCLKAYLEHGVTDLRASLVKG